MGESESAKKLEEEVGRVVEQAKELQDSASSFISKAATDDQSLRSRVVSLDSSIRRLRSLLSHNHHLLDPKLVDKAIIIILSLSLSLCMFISLWIPLPFFYFFWLILICEQLEEDLQRARCIMVDGDAASFLPPKTQGYYWNSNPNLYLYLNLFIEIEMNLICRGIFEDVSGSYKCSCLSKRRSIKG